MVRGAWAPCMNIYGEGESGGRINLGRCLISSLGDSCLDLETGPVSESPALVGAHNQFASLRS